MITTLAFVALPSKNITAARRFYEEVLGLKMSHNFMDKWIEYDLGDTALAVTEADAEHPAPATGATVALEIKGLTEFVAKLKAQGVRFSLDITETPVCRVATIHDPDGNPLMLHELKPR